MAQNAHYKELLQLLNEFEVEYLIVGGFAVMKYGEPRYTKELDVWIHNSAKNSVRVIQALKRFGVPLEHDGITAETFTEKQVVYQIGVAPVRIDILTEVTGVDFADAWNKKVQSTFFGVPVHFISFDDPVANKQALARPEQRPERPEAEPQERQPTRLKAKVLAGSGSTRSRMAGSSSLRETGMDTEPIPPACPRHCAIALSTSILKWMRKSGRNRPSAPLNGRRSSPSSASDPAVSASLPAGTGEAPALT